MIAARTTPALADARAGVQGDAVGDVPELRQHAAPAPQQPAEDANEQPGHKNQIIE